MTTVPVVYADDLTDEQVKAYRIADNRTADFAEWDYQLLVEEIGEIPEFAELLQLTDIDALVEEFDNRIDLADGVAAVLEASNRLHVICETEEEAERLFSVIADLDGVVDVTRVR